VHEERGQHPPWLDEVWRVAAKRPRSAPEPTSWPVSTSATKTTTQRYGDGDGRRFPGWRADALKSRPQAWCKGARFGATPAHWVHSRRQPASGIGAVIVRPRRWQSTAALAIRVPVTEVALLVNPSLTVRSVGGGDGSMHQTSSIETDLITMSSRGRGPFLTVFSLLSQRREMPHPPPSPEDHMLALQPGGRYGRDEELRSR
jgi:hypothetical protein